MQPAYHIALTATEKRLITDIGAIQSQIEWLMMLTVQHLLKVTHKTAQKIMGSTNFAANATIWIAVVREKHEHEEAKEWAEWAYKQLNDLTRHRNDFLHTIYGFPDLHGDGTRTAFTYGHMVEKGEMSQPRRGVRVKTGQFASLDDLKTIRDRAAYLSMAFAHVEDPANPQSFGTSPWRRRLGGQPPHQSPWSRVRTATKRKPPPQP